MGKARKPVPVTRRSKHGAPGVKRKHQKRKAESGLCRRTEPKWWGCASLVDKQAARVVGKVLGAAERKGRGVNVRSLTLASGNRAVKATHAVVCQTLKFLPILRDIVDKLGLLSDNPKLRPSLAYVLAYEVLIGQGCRPEGPAERGILKAKDSLHEELNRRMTAAGVEKPEDLIGNVESSAKVRHRFARINYIKVNLEALEKNLGKFTTFQIDSMLPDVIKFPPGTALYDHPLVQNGSLMLQGYGSCMCAHALAPKKGWLVLDACAAPGNKTVHLASLMKGEGSILAIDKDEHRLKRLAKNVDLAGATNVQFRQMDFLSLDPKDESTPPINAILLDPSCSGSGTANSRMDYLLPVKGDDDNKRISRLADFQVAVLQHALGFPEACRIVYSTCSIHEKENEDVIKRVLPLARRQGFKLKDPFPSWHRKGVPLFQWCKKLVRTDPDEDGMDGFFLAVFERKSKSMIR